MIYCTLVERYFVLNRAMRSNDVKLFALTLIQISSVFFSANHPN